MSFTSPMALRKIQKRSTETQAADTLRDAIVAGDIPLGTRLTEIAVSEQVGVSRGTIRTAFHQLVQEGLLIQIPYTGWTVMQLSSQDAWELYTLRSSLESLASKLVAKKVKSEASATDVPDQLKNAFARLKKACVSGNSSRVAQEDIEFHKTIISLSGHGRLIDQYARIEHQVRVYIQSSDALVRNSVDIVAQHEPIIETLLRGDDAAAVNAAVAHNELEGAILVAHLATLEKSD